MAAPRFRVLFACVGNAARSQMAEGFGRAFAGDRLEVGSGGSRPAGVVAPLAVAVMRERGIDISGHASKGFDEAWVRACDLVVTMGCGDDACPAFAGKRLVDWPIPDPRRQGIEAYRAARDEIERRVRGLVLDVSSSG